MDHSSECQQPILSVCISTYMRAAFIAETLDSLMAQANDAMEIIVVDGNSPDHTQHVMNEYLRRHPKIRYVREAVNSGIDGDYDKAVSYANGKYCWLMTDDDLLNPGAVERVFAALNDQPDLVVLNSQVWSADFSHLLVPRLARFTEDREYNTDEGDTLFADLAATLTFIGCVVVKRSVWMERARAAYMGTLFVHVGVIFQEPMRGRVVFIAEPLIAIRYGNAMWTARGFEIWMFKWPQLVWSFSNVGVAARRAVTQKEPWRQLRKLLLFRAIGGFGLAEYERFFASSSLSNRAKISIMARIPVRVANGLASFYCLVFAREARMNIYDMARSKDASAFSRWTARLLKIS